MRYVEGARSLMWQRLLAAAVAAALLSTLIPGLAHPYSQERMNKDIAIMENVLNTAMVESEFVYIFSTQNNVRGLHIPEFGALFTVQVQLISDWASPYLNYYYLPNAQNPGSPLWALYHMDKEKLEKLVEKLDITVNGKKVDVKEYFQQAEESDEGGEKAQARLKKREELAEKNLEKFEEELAGLVADYGGTIRQLENNQWVMIVAYMDPLRGTRQDSEARKLVVKAKKADIDLYDSGKIDYEGLKSRMTIELQ